MNAPVAGYGVLAGRWREEAQLLRRRGAAAQAEVLESCAAELDAYERERSLEALTLEQGAAESGYSYSQLQKLVGSGALTNVGDKHRPRVRRGELPRKPRRGPHEGEPDLAALVQGRRGAR
jgi:hypothetical protein